MSDEIQVKSKRGGAREFAGAPTFYKPELCQEMIDFFNIEPIEEYICTDENGNEITRQRASLFKTFEGFAKQYGVSIYTLHSWKKKHKPFTKAWRICKTMQNNYIMVNGMAGTTATAFTIFAAKNIMRWKDRHDVTSDNKATAPTTFTLKIGDE